MKLRLAFPAVIFIFLFNTLYAQNSIKGFVEDENNKLIDYFTIIVLNPGDSTVIKAGSFINGEFEFNNIQSGQYLFKISSMGYADFYKKFEIGNNISDLKLQLHSSPIHITEIEITAKLPRIINKNDRYLIEIQNTALSDAGTGLNALKRTPFVIVDNISNEISIAGRGATMILIDGRKINNIQEVEMLNSQDIKQIEIIENPSAKYEAEGHGVINIITIRNREQGINLNLLGSYGRGRHDSGKVLGSITYVTNKIILFSQYGFNADNSEGYNSSLEKFEKPDYSFISSQKNLRNLYETRMSDYAIGINYTPTPEHSFGFKYDGYSGNIYSHTINETDVIKNEVKSPTETLIKQGKDSPKKNGFNLNYQFTSDKFELSLITDYTNSKTNSKNDLEEKDKNNTYDYLKTNNWSSKYYLYSIQLDTKIPINYINSSLEIGGKYSDVTSNNESNFYNKVKTEWMIDPEFTSAIDFNEKIIGTFVLLNGKINDNFQYQAGVRYEYSDNKNQWNSINDSIERSHTSNLFPSILITHKIKDNLSFRLSYSKRISRPSYESLNNSVWYINSYSSRQGNPYLKSTIFNTFSLSSQINKINASFNISYIENPTDLLYINDPEQIEKHVIIRTNTKNRWSFGMNVNASYSYKKWSLQPFLMVSYVKRSIIEDNITYTTDYPGIYLSLRNQFNLYKGLDMDVDLTYNKPSHSFKKFNDQYIFNLSIRQKLLKDRLTLQLGAEFIPVKWKQKMDYSYKYIDFVWDGDNRKYVTLSVRYNFNTTKKQFKSKTSNTDELRRM